MAKLYSYAELKDGYTKLWNGCTVTRTSAADTEASKIIKFKDRYKALEAKTGVPWFCIGIIHTREAGSSDVGRWKCCLHNGQRIIGTGEKTTIVPAGKGPFATFDEAAIDALKGYKDTSWTPEFLAYTLEKFNGFGYRGKGMPSPYLWGSTNRQTPGKYVADHVFDPSVMDTQVGGMALLKSLMKLDPSVNFNKPIITKTTGGIIGAIMAAFAAAGAWIHTHRVGLIVTGVTLAALYYAVKYLHNRRKTNA